MKKFSFSIVVDTYDGYCFLNCFYTTAIELSLENILYVLGEKYRFNYYDLHLRKNKLLLLNSCDLNLYSTIKRDIDDKIIINDVEIKINGKEIYPMYLRDKFFEGCHYKYAR